MKKLLTISFLILGINLFAQNGATDKGVIFVSGFSNLNITFAEGTPINLGARGGYFFAKDILIGVGLDYLKISDSSTSNFSLFGRYYIKGKFFAGAKLYSIDVEQDNGDTKKQWNLGLEGGYAYFLNDYVALEPALIIPFEKEGKPMINVSLSVYF